MFCEPLPPGPKSVDAFLSENPGLSNGASLLTLQAQGALGRAPVEAVSVGGQVAQRHQFRALPPSGGGEASGKGA